MDGVRGAMGCWLLTGALLLLAACGSDTPGAGEGAGGAGAGGAGAGGAGSEVWTQVVGDGFGYPDQVVVPEVEVFDGYLYVATAPLGPGTARIHRSATGEAGSWEQVTPPLNGDRSIHAFGVTTLGGGYLWCGTGAMDGGMIFRTANGTDWIPIAERGFGDPLRRNATPHMVVFQGSADTEPYLYAAMNSHGSGTPAVVSRIPYTDTDPASWVQLLDFATINPAIDQVTYFVVWNDTLYFATNAGGQLWQTSDGTSFTQNTSVGNGFGNPDNRLIASMVVFDGSLYATTNNIVDGGQLWRSGDGASWQQITADAFGKGPSAFELRSIRPSGGRLWLTAYTNVDVSAGTPVWRSDDGLTFVQSNVDGFGDPDNNGENAVTIGFGGRQYLGGPNYVAGGQLWRTDG